MKRIIAVVAFMSFLFAHSCDFKKVGELDENVNLFICPPCDQSCDKLSFNEDGICPHCKMHLIVAPDSALVNDANLRTETGNFFVNKSSDDKRWVQVFYSAPPNIDSATKVLIVLPGAGRNGHDYRDVWSVALELKNVIVLALTYPEETYDLGGYHMAGMIDSIIYDGDYQFVQNDDYSTWLFNDFDRIFDLVVKANSLDATSYDLFGHSAGGQVLHRHVLFFHKDNKVDHILAANSGWYTMPNTTIGLPYGIKNTIVDEEFLEDSYQEKLTIMVGEDDNASETRGSLRRTELANQQGAHRLERAHYFYNYNKELSKEIDIDFNWNLVVVEGVGHDYQKISAAAAQLLYNED